MRISLILVGKTTDKNIAILTEKMAERVTHYLPFEISILPELKNTQKLSVEEQKRKEGEMILKKISTQDHVILLDERGQEFRSVDFAKWITKKSLHSKPLTFIVGGPYGFSSDVYDRANEMMSLSKMTFSHQMVRLFFVEQLYRACTINKGEPYHHE